LTPINERRAAGLFANGKKGDAARAARWQIAKPGALEKTFREAFFDTFGETEAAQCPAWTREQLGMVNSVVIKRWRGDTQSLHGFVDWCVREWLAIRKKTFGYRRKQPSRVLSLQFFIAAIDEFRDAWNDRARLGWVNVDWHRPSIPSISGRPTSYQADRRRNSAPIYTLAATREPM
jgi:hypothetical protein